MESEAPMNGLSEFQRRTLFATIREAAREQGEEPETYRRRIMRDELGVEHLSQVSATSGFDTLMARVCADAGDAQRAAIYATQAARRLQHVIIEAARRLAPAHPCDYVAAVMVQSRLAPVGDNATLADRLRNGSAWLDVPEPHLRRILVMLKTHIRRHAD